MKIIAKLNEKLIMFWQVFDFIMRLQFKYSKILQHYEDISNFKVVTLNNSIKYLNRSARLAGTKNQSIATINTRLIKQYISNNLKPLFKFKKSIILKELSIPKRLMLDQKHHVKYLIKVKGVKFIGRDTKKVQK